MELKENNFNLIPTTGYKIQKAYNSFFKIHFLEEKRRMEIKKVNMQFSKGR